MKAHALGVALLVLTTSASALGAEWLPGPSRAITLADSASPDAPVTSYAFGPRARASVGGDFGLILLPGRASDLRLGLSALVALDDAEHGGVFPSQLFRTSFALGAAWASPGSVAAADGRARLLELGLTLGLDAAKAFGGYTLSDRYHADDVPFGAGGGYLGVDAAFCSPLPARLVFTSRVGIRVYTNAFPDAVGQTEASDAVADFAREGSELRTSFELGLRFRASDYVEPLLRVYADSIIPHDDSAKMLWLGRALFGLAHPGRTLELTPFLDLEAGHGQGLLVNRTELRFGGGVRIHAR
jgi:hypothetical protein